VEIGITSRGEGFIGTDKVREETEAVGRGTRLIESGGEERK
jgi:hypothetical protein